MIKNLITLFQQYFNEPVIDTSQPPLHGSNRLRYRLKSKSYSAMGVVNPDRDENIAFISFAKHFRKHGLPVPEIFAENLDEHIYLEEDLGNQTLLEFFQHEQRREGEFPESVILAYEKVVRLLPNFQIKAASGLDYSVCYPRARFDRQSIIWDLNYFKYYFLKLADIPFHEQKLEDDFKGLANFLLEADQEYFMLRDCQSRNIMMRDGEPYLIDFQGGRKGALQYDIASLLFQARVNMPSELREQLLVRYLDAVEKHIELDRTEFMKYYYPFVLMRILQTLGAYGFRGFYERKIHFLQSIPNAVRNLDYLQKNVGLPIKIPILDACLSAIIESINLWEKGNEKKGLTVHIESFSYRSGIPKDDSEHGGGFVFDCRLLPNPGRLEAYKLLNGNDSEVIRFFKNEKTADAFLTGVKNLIGEAVESYQGRNYNRLSVAFGCTGGQHRSVYCANQLEKFLREKYAIKINLSHREANNWSDTAHHGRHKAKKVGDK